MKFTSWGNYPKAKGNNFSVESLVEIKDILAQNNQTLAQGNHRSYGDSAFAEAVIDMKKMDYFFGFDKQIGSIQVQSGILLSDLLEIIVPQGWLLPVMPGTQLITIGGAIASDVHGKNHHNAGTFSQFVTSLRLMLSNGEIIECSKIKNKKAFYATCGGMGLTGIILDATIQLTTITSNKIIQKTIKTLDLKQTFTAFEENQNSTYSVAWIDCLAQDDELGKSIVFLGEPENQGELSYQYKTKIKMPLFLPSFILNSWSIKLFNWFYYFIVKEKTKSVSLQQFFFPLDGIVDWNKMYGKKGFLQYQVVIPINDAFAGVSEILQKISDSKQGSFLAVLKRMGNANNNLLSFPMDGYTLALDFKVNKKVFKLLDELDEIVIKYKGRIYLCKDARMSSDTFNQGYKQADKFRQFRKDSELDKHFQSHQSQRLKL